MASLKVAVVASFAPSLVKFRGSLLQAMVGEGWDVHALAPEDDPGVRATLEAWGVTFHIYPLHRQGTHPLKDLRTMEALYRKFRHIQPDAVLVYTVKPVIWGTLAAALAGVPRRVAMITGMGAAFTPPYNVKKRLVRGVLEVLYRLALPFAHTVVVQNPDDRAVVRRWVADGKIAQIPGSGVDLTFFQPAPYPETLTFLMLSRLIVDKGVREYVAAAREVKRRHPDVRFLLAGWFEPDYPGSITREEFEAWQREGVVEYLGVLEDVRPALAQCSVYVLPSYREGTPRSVLEAMAMGRPIITTDAPGCRQTVRDGENGFLVPVRDVQALVQAMTFFVEHPEAVPRMGKASRTLAETVFDVHRVNARLLSLLSRDLL